MEILGKIDWLSPAPTEYPVDSGEFNIGIKVKGEFYNLYKPIAKLNKMLEMLKIGYAVRLQVEGGKIQDIEVTSDKVEPKSDGKSNGNWADEMNNFEDLLADAHKKYKDKLEIVTEVIKDGNGNPMIDLEKKFAFFKATVIIDGKRFVGHGDATQENVTSNLIQPHFIRMAETRAIVRALRFATNNAKVSVEETTEVPKKSK